MAHARHSLIPFGATNKKRNPALIGAGFRKVLKSFLCPLCKHGAADFDPIQ